MEVRPGLREFRELWARHRAVPAWVDLALDQETPVSLFRKLVGRGRGYLLESLSGGEESARYSFVGARPLRWLRVARGPGRPWPDVFAALRRFAQPGCAPALPPWTVRFAGGAVGYLAYDAVRALEPLGAAPPDDLGLPLAVWVDCALVAAVDHRTHRLTLITAARRGDGRGGGPGGDAERAYAAARAALQQALVRLMRPLPPLPPLPAPGGPPPAPVRSSLTREEFLARVRRAREYIAAGDAFQVVVSQRFEDELPRGADAFDLYRALRVVSPSPYMFFLRLGADLALAGASPELLVGVEGRRAVTRPLAGTRPRGRDAAEDARLAAELQADPKERAEHVMLVDLGRNDLGRVCRFGSVRVERLMDVERYSHVMHLVSEVAGELRDGCDAVDALAACFPAGTLTGAPKVRAMQIIDELEPVARGPYGGAVGALGFDGSLLACIAIRTFVVRGRRVFLQCGAGVVADSDPEREYQETVAKGRAGMAALALLRAAGTVPAEGVARRAGAGGG